MLPWWEVLLRLLVASIVGGLIGWERESSGKSAGFRTIMLVTVAAAVYVLAATQAAAAVGEVQDAGRLMAGVAGGVGFLGAGLIFRARGGVRGLTTAAALWVSAGLGLAVALGMYVVAIGGSVLVLAILRWLTLVEERLIPRRSRKVLKATPSGREEKPPSETKKQNRQG